MIGRVLLLAMAMTMTTSTLAAAAELPRMENPALSPDGRYVAYLVRDTAGNAALERIDLDRDDARRRVLDSGAVDGGSVLDWCGWGSSERLLCRFHHGRAGAEVSGIVAVNPDGSDLRTLLRQVRPGADDDQHKRPQVIGWEQDDLKSVLVALHAPGEDYPSVQRLDLYSGALELEIEAQAPIESFILDEYGEVRFGWGRARDGTVSAFSRLGKARPWRGLKWQRLRRFAPASGPNVLRPLEGYRYIGDFVPALGRDEHGDDAIWHIDVTDRTDPERVRPGLGESRPIVSPRGRLLGLEFVEGGQPPRWMDGRLGNVVEHVGAQLAGADLAVLDYVDNPSRFIVRSRSGQGPARIYLYGIAGGDFELRELGRVERAPQPLQAPPRSVAKAPAAGPPPSDADDLDLLITVLDPASGAPVAGLPMRVVLSSDPDWRAPDAGRRYVTDERGRVRDTRKLRTQSRRVELDLPLVTHKARGFEIGLEVQTGSGMPLLYTLTLDDVKKGTLISGAPVYTRGPDGAYTRQVDLDWEATTRQTGDVYTRPPRDPKTFERLPDPPPHRLTQRSLQLIPHPKADGSNRWALDLRLTLDPYRPGEGG